MKKLLFGIMLMLPILCNAQTDSTNFEFSLIDTLDGTKTELFVNAKAWLAKTFVSSKSVIEMEDKDAGKIIGNGVITKRVNSTLGNQIGIDIIFFTVNIDTKDNKYRCILSNFTHKYSQQTSTYIPGQPLATSMGSAFSQNRNGGPLKNEKPLCSGLVMTKKQWTKIKDFAETESLATIQELKKYMHTAKQNANF